MFGATNDLRKPTRICPVTALSLLHNLRKTLCEHRSKVFRRSAWGVRPIEIAVVLTRAVARDFSVCELLHRQAIVAHIAGMGD